MKKIARIQKKYFASSPFGGKFSSLRPFVARAAFFALLLTTFVLFVANCRNEAVKPQTNAPTREVTDDLNRRVPVPATIERAVSLAPNLTEIAFAVGAGERLVGVTTYCDYPLEARKIQKIGDTISPNIENIIALKPQIVLVSTASQMENFTKQLEAQNIAVFVTNPNSLDDIYASINKIGEIFGKTEQSNRIVANLKTRVAAVEAATGAAKPVKVFVQISRQSIFTVGKDSYITDLIRRAGGVSLTENIATAYPNLSRETASALAPDAIILSESGDNREPNDVFDESPAVKNGRVFKVSADLLSRPAPRVVDGLEQMARALHPENFK